MKQNVLIDIINRIYDFEEKLFHSSIVCLNGLKNTLEKEFFDKRKMDRDRRVWEEETQYEEYLKEDY